MRKFKVLVPTDFSDCAQNALNYAIGFAKDLNADIVILHAISYDDAIYTNAEVTAEENTERYNFAKTRLENSLDYIKTVSPDVQVKTILKGGLAELSISSVLEEEGIDFIIMGTKGASGFKAGIFGSFTNNVILVSSCPVFTIPLSGEYKGVKDIVCATEMDKSEVGAIKSLLALAEKFNAHITFYNVNSNPEEQRVAFHKFEKLIKELSNYSFIDFVVVESREIIESIDNYVCEKNPDLVVTLGKERNFFDKFFGKKVTKSLCLHSAIPLLSFPNNGIKENEEATANLIKKYYH